MTMLSMNTFLPYFLASIILSGIAASARMKEESHSDAQLISGFAAGFAVVTILYFILF